MQYCQNLAVFNLQAKTELLIYDNGGSSTSTSTPLGRWRTISKTELKEKNGFFKNPLYTLHKKPK